MGSKLDYSSLPDENLLLLLKKGDGLAFGEMFERYGPVLTSFAYRKTLDWQIAKDIVQDTFTYLWWVFQRKCSLVPHLM